MLKGLYSIPMGVSFLNTLAQTILQCEKDDPNLSPLKLAHYTILLPTKRGCLELKNILAGLKPHLIFPKILTIDEWMMFYDFSEERLIGSFEKLGLLTNLTRQGKKNFPETFGLSQSLLSFLDEIQTSQISFDQLQEILKEAPNELRSLLAIILEFWPSILKDMECVESYDVHKTILSFLTHHFNESPYEHPIWMVGTTGTRPATAQLAKLILNQPQGAVILPGYQSPYESIENVENGSFMHGAVHETTLRNCDFRSNELDNKKETLPPTHPFYTMQQFIRFLTDNNNHSNIKLLAEPHPYISHLMTPMLHSKWHVSYLKDYSQHSIQKNFHTFECKTLDEEVQMITNLICYELSLKTPSIVVVTPDQELSYRLRVSLEQKKIYPNTSFGRPLTQTPVGIFTLLAIRLLQEQELNDFMALLKHPFFARTWDRGKHLSWVRMLERKILRRPPHFPKDLENLKVTNNLWEALSNLDLSSLDEGEQNAPFITPEENEGSQNESTDGEITHWYHIVKPSQWFQHIVCMFQKLSAQNEYEEKSLYTHLNNHKKLLEALVGPKPEVLWEGDDGQEVHVLFSELLENASHFPSLTLKDYHFFLTTMMRQKNSHPVEGIGSPVKILGTLESRMHDGDVVILASLNEGTWPQIPSSDPFLSPMMRAQIGLFDQQRKVGLSAHDFCYGLCANKVYLTRSCYRDGASTIASRWLKRLELFFSPDLHPTNPIEVKEPLSVSLIQKLHNWSNYHPKDPNLVNIVNLAKACPPLEVRPTRLSVTAIDRLMLDPYSIYAETILKLKPLEKRNLLGFNLSFSPKDRGVLLHHIFDVFVKMGPPYTYDNCFTLAEKVLKPWLDQPVFKTFLWPRTQKLLQWFVDQLDPQNKMWTEVKGKLEITLDNGSIFTLTAVADRIDKTPKEVYKIIDYKTGYVPSHREMTLGFYSQLLLEGIILMGNGFDHETGPHDLQALEFWQVGQSNHKIIPIKNHQDLLEKAKEGLVALLTYFQSKESIYHACPHGHTAYNLYSHLERLSTTIL